jgi:hypothetical protein
MSSSLKIDYPRSGHRPNPIPWAKKENMKNKQKQNKLLNWVFPRPSLKEIRDEAKYLFEGKEIHTHYLAGPQLLRLRDFVHPHK